MTEASHLQQLPTTMSINVTRETVLFLQVCFSRWIAQTGEPLQLKLSYIVQVHIAPSLYQKHVDGGF